MGELSTGQVVLELAPDEAGLPELLRAGGLHPHYAVPPFRVDGEADDAMAFEVAGNAAVFLEHMVIEGTFHDALFYGWPGSGTALRRPFSRDRGPES